MRGFADLHNHQFAYLGFGGMAFHGRAFGVPWVKERNRCGALAQSGNRIGVLQRGVVWVKEGPLDAPWVKEMDGCEALALSGNRIGVLGVDKLVWVKEGPLDAPWVKGDGWVRGPGPVVSIGASPQREPSCGGQELRSPL